MPCFSHGEQAFLEGSSGSRGGHDGRGPSAQVGRATLRSDVTKSAL